MTDDELSGALEVSVRSLRPVTDRDWTVPAGTLDWSCWRTVDHVIDCIFSYTLQLAAKAPSAFLPFSELHALPSATANELVDGLEAVGTMLLAVANAAPSGTTASDGFMVLDVGDWRARAAFELILHTHDAAAGLGVVFEPPTEICAAVLASPALWMLDRARASGAPDPWSGLLLGSGRR